ncbi:ergothioneine biosynthesis glutamate--cysteine ligase EgtA [Actinocorallia sp. A-T 12471]|uniref:ergothioneine biosynthesis glutamate--cysteine ligase EgtA n=1 Tax=Actinocorallia sp. A-T 12471 TaxID=3089813 RepID=UPI0029CEA574|nr:ergothioneine biosynthesis glutamate--cysteine ligase EgtA [Actinocorallia sp. A-T 12471]MDX6738952.1 ergothioneine biosynthesis glutamate--cysteine ligase EgtA [Actinocorallia sp. A-T 12471]
MSVTVEDVYEHVHGVCFKKGPPGTVGAETEWFVREKGRPLAHVPVARLRAAMAEPLPGGSRVTFEPGGQLELSSVPMDGPEGACAVLAADLAETRRRLPGLELLGMGVDPERPARLQVRDERYRTMSRYFDDLTMMCSTASVQVCLDIGRDAAEAARRWRLAHLLGPVLVAAFANSPLRAGRRTGHLSTRQAVWAGMDRSRTTAPVGDVPETAWAEYALDARVMLIRRAEGWVENPGITFRQWIHEGGPTADDLRYHLTTLFPPVRPQGWLELRMIDELPDPYWRVPVALAAALLDRAPDAAERAAAPAAGLWARAARDGLRDPVLARAAVACFEAAVPRLQGPLRELVEEYAERYVVRGLCPAEDVLKGEHAWTR